MSHMTALSMEAGSQVARGLALGVIAVDRFGAEIRRERRAAASSVQELAIRLQEARADQAHAQRRAAAAERTVAEAAREIAELRAALRREQAHSATLREILGV